MKIIVAKYLNQYYPLLRSPARHQQAAAALQFVQVHSKGKNGLAAGAAPAPAVLITS